MIITIHTAISPRQTKLYRQLEKDQVETGLVTYQSLCQHKDDLAMTGWYNPPWSGSFPAPWFPGSDFDEDPLVDSPQQFAHIMEP